LAALVLLLCGLAARPSSTAAGPNACGIPQHNEIVAVAAQSPYLALIDDVRNVQIGTVVYSRLTVARWYPESVHPTATTLHARRDTLPHTSCDDVVPVYEPGRQYLVFVDDELQVSSFGAFEIVDGRLRGAGAGAAAVMVGLTVDEAVAFARPALDFVLGAPAYPGPRGPAEFTRELVLTIPRVPDDGLSTIGGSVDRLREYFPLWIEGVVTGTEVVRSDYSPPFTFATVRVERWLVGRPRMAPSEVIVAQRGGYVRRWAVVGFDDPLMTAGERYVFGLPSARGAGFSDALYGEAFTRFRSENDRLVAVGETWRVLPAVHKLEGLSVREAAAALRH
jgi:hypothetical protein